MKNLIKRVLGLLVAFTVGFGVIPMSAFADNDIPYSVLFTWNFTTSRRFYSQKVSGNSGTVVSWGDYRATFLAFPIPQDSGDAKFVIKDENMVFDNGRVEGQAPTITIKTIDGDELVNIYNRGLSSSQEDKETQRLLESLIASGVEAGTFSTLYSNNSEILDLSGYIQNAKQNNKKYIGFYLTCRSEDGAKIDEGIVNFVSPTLSPPPVFEENKAFKIEIEPALIKVGESVTITPNISPEKVNIISISSKDENIAQARVQDNKIIILGKSVGFCDIVLTAKYENTEKKESFKVMVTNNSQNQKLESISLIKDYTALPIIMDLSYPDEKSYRQISRAVNDLRQDFSLVCGGISQKDIPIDDTPQKQAQRLSQAKAGTVPRLFYGAENEIENAIIVGEIESSGIIKDIALSGKFDEAANILGKWEGYAIKMIKDPIPNVKNALVIAGSDARGTIYGIYYLSQYLGVSPWYWWSDVPVRIKANVTYNEDVVINPGPSVKYRGIFINDEERLVDWAEEHFPNDVAHDGTKINGPNEYIYRHLFEAILRTGGNTLWPAMHEYTTAFNYDLDTDNIPKNAKAADEYGIIMSTSHCEILLRNNVGEWQKWYNENKAKYNIQGSDYNAAYDYTLNKAAILAYWKERVLTNRHFENIFVLGIRGVHDGAPRYANLQGAGYGTGTAGIVNMMKDVITEQRKIIKEIYGSEDAVPQVFIPYKEMNTYYNYNNGELAKWLPDDIIIMYAEDNQNYLRQTSTSYERSRSGGLGIYYHSSYWGSPKSYLWLNSTPVYLMYEELKKAYDTGSQTYWILNVGDLKPGEILTEFFMTMAFDINKYNDKNLTGFYVKQGMRDYNLSENEARLYAQSMADYSRYIQTKKPEFFGYQSSGGISQPSFSASRAFPFSITQHGDEGQIRVDEWNKLVDDLYSLYEKMDDDTKCAFYQQVLYAALSNRNRTEEYVYYWKNNLYAQQGRYASAKAYQNLSQEAVRRIDEDQSYFGALNSGKWKRIINYDHPVSYYGTNEGILKVKESMYQKTSPSHGVGAVCEGQRLPGDDVTLKFHSLADNQRFIDIFGKNDTFENYIIECDDFIILSKTRGQVYTEERIIASIDWSKLNDGENYGFIRVYNADENYNKEGLANEFKVAAYKTSIVLEKNSYMEANGFVSINAVNYTEMLPSPDGSYWGVVNNLGKSGGAVKAFPDLSKKVTGNYEEESAKLIYRIYFTSTGTFNGVVHRIPTLNEGFENGIARSCHIGVGLSGGKVNILKGNRETSGTWADNVMRGYEVLPFTITIDSPGYYDLVIYKIDSSICFDKIIISTSETDESLTGPPVSPNNISYSKGKIGNVPKEVLDFMPQVLIQPFGDVAVKAGTVSEINLAYGPGLEVVCENTGIAALEYKNNKLRIYGIKEGIANVTLKTSSGMQRFTVTVIDDTNAFLEIGGEVVISFKDILDKPYVFAAASSDNIHYFAKSGDSLQVLPNTGKNWLDAASALNSPKLSIKVKFTKRGTYYVAGNFSNPDASSDSFYFGVNGNVLFSSATSNNRVVTNQNEWFSHPSWTFYIESPGVYTINIWPREDGVKINQLVLSQNQIEDGITGNLRTPKEILPYLDLTVEEKVDADIYIITQNDLSIVENNITLPSIGVFGSLISWKSDNEAILSSTGAVNRPKTNEDNAYVILTATFSYGAISKQVPFYITVPKIEKKIISSSGTAFCETGEISGSAYISFNLKLNLPDEGYIGVAPKDGGGLSLSPVLLHIKKDGYIEAASNSAFENADLVKLDEGKDCHIVLFVDVNNETFSAYAYSNGSIKTIARDFNFNSPAIKLEKILAWSQNPKGFLIENIIVSPHPYILSNAFMDNEKASVDILSFSGMSEGLTCYIAFYKNSAGLKSVVSESFSTAFLEKAGFLTEVPDGFDYVKFMVFDKNLNPKATFISLNKKPQGFIMQKPKT